MCKRVRAFVALLVALVFASDATAQNLYYVESMSGDDALVRANLDGSNREIVLRHQDVVEFGQTLGIEFMFPIGQGLTVDPIVGKLYWIARDTGGEPYVLRSNLDGAEVEVLIEPPRLVDPVGSGGILFPLVVYRSEAAAQKLYYVESASGDGALVRANLDGSNREIVLRHQDVVELGQTLGIDFQHPIDEGLTVDPVAGKLYWTARDTIGAPYVLRSNLDGAELEVLIEPPLLINPEGQPSGILAPLVVYRPSALVPAVGTIGLAIMVALLVGARAFVMKRRSIAA